MGAGGIFIGFVIGMGGPSPSTNLFAGCIVPNNVRTVKEIVWRGQWLVVSGQLWGSGVRSQKFGLVNREPCQFWTGASDCSFKLFGIKSDLA